MDAKFSQLFQNTGGEDLVTRSRVGHSLRPIFMLWLVKIWQVSSCGKCMQHLETCLLCWSWQSFVSTCDVFNCLFPLDVQNEIQLLSRVFCYSWLVCVLVFWLRDASLVKVGNPISDGIVFVFHLACRAWPTHDHSEKSQKQPSSLPVKTGWIFASEVSLKSRF